MAQHFPAQNGAQEKSTRKIIPLLLCGYASHVHCRAIQNPGACQSPLQVEFWWQLCVLGGLSHPSGVEKPDSDSPLRWHDSDSPLRWHGDLRTVTHRRTTFAGNAVRRPVTALISLIVIHIHVHALVVWIVLRRFAVITTKTLNKTAKLEGSICLHEYIHPQTYQKRTSSHLLSLHKINNKNGVHKQIYEK